MMARLTQQLLDSFGEHVALLDARGKITAVNRAWRHFARDNGGRETGYLAANYLDICRRAAGTGDETARVSLTGIEAVLQNTQPDFSLEYPCHAPTRARWFTMTVTPLEAGAVVTHREVAEPAARYLKAVCEGLDTALYVYDRGARTLYLNRAARQLSARYQEEPLGVGTPLAQSVPSTLIPECLAVFGAALHGEPAASNASTAGGYEVKAQPIFKNGTVTEVCLSLRKGNRASSDELTPTAAVRDVMIQPLIRPFLRAFHRSPVPMLLVTRQELRVAQANASFLQLAGYPRHEVIGQTLSKLSLWPKLELSMLTAEKPSGEAAFPQREQAMWTRGGLNQVVLSAEAVKIGEPRLLLTCLAVQAYPAPERLRRAIKEAMQDADWLGRAVMEKLAQQRFASPDYINACDLTHRERQVLQLLADGHNNQSIAETLSISHQTVRNYISRVYDKLNVHSRAEAVVWAREHGLTG